MFANPITSTPVASNRVADYYFTNIAGAGYAGDVSFLSTLRVLLAPRLKTDDSICLKFGNTSYTEDTIKTHRIDVVLSAMLSSNNLNADQIENMLYIHIFSGNQSENTANMVLVKSSFEQTYSDWHRLNKVTEFFGKTMNVQCFINPERKATVVFVSEFTVKKMHYLQCAIPALLPWYFNPGDGVSPLEMELLESFREKTSAKYEDCIKKLAEQYDFRTKRIREDLAGFESKFLRIECDTVRQDIGNVVEQINLLNGRISTSLQDKYKLEIKLLGLETKIQENEESDSEIMEYFLCNKKLFLESVTDNDITFSCVDYLTYFDEDMARSAIDNRRSVIYRPNGKACNNYIKEDDMRKLMSAIFIDQTLRIKMCSAYRLELRGSAAGLSEYTYGLEFNDCMPNPHIDKYSCLGSYMQAINQCMMAHNYIGAIEQCIASCKSLNFGDITVMEEFMRRLYGLNGSSVNNRCIELPDGRVVTPTEAVDWIHSEEKEQEDAQDE